MRRCKYCDHIISPDAKKCPGCGDPDPENYYDYTDDVSSYTVDAADYTFDKYPMEILQEYSGKTTAIIGLCLGIIVGFDIGGVGGSLLFGVLFTIGGFIVGLMIPFLLAFSIIGVVIVIAIGLAVYIFTLLWGLGKP